MVKKIIALAIVVGIVGGVLAGCGSKDDSGAAAPATTAGTAGTAATAGGTAPAATAGATAGTTTG